MAWCHVPGMDCPSAQAAEAWIWASCSPNPAITHAPLSSGRVAASCARRRPARWRCFAPAPIWDDLRTFDARLFRGAFDIVLAGLPPLPACQRGRESAAVPTIPVTSGPRSPASSASATPNGSFSKTSLATSPSVLKPSCESFGAWATRLRQACSARQKSARRTNGSGSSSWPTPIRPASRHRQLQSGWKQRLYPQGGSAGAGHHQLVDAQGDGWGEGWAGPDLWLGRDATLPAQAARWRTPVADDQVDDFVA